MVWTQAAEIFYSQRNITDKFKNTHFNKIRLWIVSQHLEVGREVNQTVGFPNWLMIPSHSDTALSEWTEINYRIVCVCAHTGGYRRRGTNHKTSRNSSPVIIDHGASLLSHRSAEKTRRGCCCWSARENSIRQFETLWASAHSVWNKTVDTTLKLQVCWYTI